MQLDMFTDLGNKYFTVETANGVPWLNLESVIYIWFDLIFFAGIGQ